MYILTRSDPHLLPPPWFSLLHFSCILKLFSQSSFSPAIQKNRHWQLFRTLWDLCHCIRYLLFCKTVTLKFQNIRNSSAFGLTVTESGLFKVCFQQRAGFFGWIYTFLRTLQQVQSPGLNSYIHHATPGAFVKFGNNDRTCQRWREV